MLLLLALAALTHNASAAPPISVEARWVLGSTSDFSGWNECLIHLTNRRTQAVRGTVELYTPNPKTDSEYLFATRSAFALERLGRSTLRLPLLQMGRSEQSFKVVVRATDGQQLASTALVPHVQRGLLVVDLDPRGRARAILRDTSVTLLPAQRSYFEPWLVIGSAQSNPATGLPFLATVPASYSAATLVLAPSSLITGLSPAELQIVGDWLVAGGTLAIIPDDEAALARSPFVEWLGGQPHRSSVPESLLNPRRFIVGRDSSTDPDQDAPPSMVELIPSGGTKHGLRAFLGGNLRESQWGAAATYGLGEVHLLAFNPALSPFAEDPWSKRQLVDLAQHSTSRYSSVARFRGIEASQGIRRILDPNRRARWTLLLASGLLVLYALVAGPINFHLAARSGRPLMALPRLVALSAAMGAIIVAIGILNRGIVSRARHIALIQLGAGIPRGSALRYRGFYTPMARQLRVSASSIRAVLRPTDYLAPQPWLDSTPDGLVLSGFRTRPWQFTLLQDEGFASLGAGITLQSDLAGTLRVTNRSGRDLLAVVIWNPLDHSFYCHARIADGQKLRASAGVRHPAPTSSGSSRSAATLGISRFSKDLEPTVPGFSDGWTAIEESAESVDWWPEDVPVLIAQLEGGEGRLTDSGIPLDFDQTLVRVVGYGGRP